MMPMAPCRADEGARTRKARFALALCLLFALGCGHRNSLSGAAWQALRDGADFELVSLDPIPPEEKSPDMLYEWKVLGRAKVTSAEVREKLIGALEKSIAEPDSLGPAGCFMPRHAISVTYDGHKYDVLVCFQCSWIYWYVDGKKQNPGLVIGSSQHATFDQAFKGAGLPLADVEKR